MDKRRFVFAVAGLMLLTLSVRHPSADIRVLTHDAGDTAPHQMQAAVDIGIMAFSILITWTGKRLITAS